MTTSSDTIVTALPVDVEKEISRLEAVKLIRQCNSSTNENR